MADRSRLFSIDDLPSHLILEILTSGERLSAVDLVSLELTSRTFGGCHGVYPTKCRSLVDLAAFQLCMTNGIYIGMSCSSQTDIFERCDGNWKRVLRFLQSVEQSSDMVQTSAGNVTISFFFFLNILILIILLLELIIFCTLAC